MILSTWNLTFGAHGNDRRLGIARLQAGNGNIHFAVPHWRCTRAGSPSSGNGYQKKNMEFHEPSWPSRSIYAHVLVFLLFMKTPFMLDLSNLKDIMHGVGAHHKTSPCERITSTYLTIKPTPLTTNVGLPLSPFPFTPSPLGGASSRCMARGAPGSIELDLAPSTAAEP